MGEIADMMLDGPLEEIKIHLLNMNYAKKNKIKWPSFCEGCGVFLNEEQQGYPCYCEECNLENETEKQS